MTALEPLDPAGWATSGVDLQTRRRRVLAGLAHLGRIREQRQFEAQYQALLAVADALADGYVQAKYLHVRIALTTPGWAERWDALYRRRNPRALEGPSVPQASPSLDWVGADDEAGPDPGEAERFWAEG